VTLKDITLLEQINIILNSSILSAEKDYQLGNLKLSSSALFLNQINSDTTEFDYNKISRNRSVDLLNTSKSKVVSITGRVCKTSRIS
jgi:hypothetical protein